MTTQVFLLGTAPELHLGTDNANLRGTNSNWRGRGTDTSRGSGVAASANTATVAGTTLGVEVNVGAGPVEWITPPLDADVTISGTITGNIWASESAMNANVAINFVVDRLQPDGTITQIVKSARTTEVAVTTRAVNNFTASPTSTACNKGDRLRIRIFGDDAGTMASGFTFNASYNGSSASADGDTFVTFNETFGFQTTDPTGSTLYLTDTASDVATSDVDREAWTSRGGGVANDVTNTASGWTALIQVTDAAGGTAVTWFSKQLEAFTLSGKIKANIWANESNAAANASIGMEVARVDPDGTNATVWAYANVAPTTIDFGELGTSEEARTAYLAADDLAFTDGQRLRIRLFVDDQSAAALVAGHTVTTYYNGTSGGASGDTFLTLEQTVNEFTAGGGATVTPGVIARSFSIPQASPQASVSLTPATITGSVSVPQAQAGASISIVPDPITRSFVIPQASVSAGASPTPGVIARSFVLGQASPQAGASLTPGVIPLAVVLPQAVPGIGASVAPNVIARAFALPQTGVQAGASITPGVIARAFSILQAEARAGVSITPGLIALAFVVPQVTINAGGNVSVTPDVIARAFSIAQAQAQASSQVTPGVLALAFVVPQATPNTGSSASVTPDPVVLVFVVPQVEENLGATPTPTVIPLAFVIPQATPILGAVGTPVEGPTHARPLVARSLAQILEGQNRAVLLGEGENG